MIYQTLVTAADLSQRLDEPNWVVLDCRFSLSEPQQASQSYLQAHIPGASYAHLETDLSAPHIPGVTGRHPLPEIDTLTQKFTNWGISSEVQVVCYDDAGGALAAARAWWLLRWLGHSSVAVLDGGWQKWLDDGYSIHSGSENRFARSFDAHPRPELLMTANNVAEIRLDPNWLVLDARSAERFCGKNETIDPIAGHIPGAVSAPYGANLTTSLTFRSVDALRRRYQRLIGGIPARNCVFYCGSGVTAAHDVLALLHAGLGETGLYAGSWSDWITDPSRPVADGLD